MVKAGIESRPGEGVVYAGLAQALAVPETDVRVFGKPVAHVGRRMGVAVAGAETVDEARARATLAASLVSVRTVGPSQAASASAED